MTPSAITITPILTLPPELHLIIISFLPRIAQYELSLACKSFRALAPVKLDKDEAVELHLQVVAKKEGGCHGVCHSCCRVLPFYFFIRTGWGFMKARPDGRQNSSSRVNTQHPPIRPYMCLACMGPYVKIWDVSVRYFPMGWWFDEFIVMCPECARFVRCPKLSQWLLTSVINAENIGDFRLETHMPAHDDCPFPHRTPQQALEFASNYKWLAEDEQPLVLHKIYLMQMRKELYPPTRLGKYCETPLHVFRGLREGEREEEEEDEEEEEKEKEKEKERGEEEEEEEEEERYFLDDV